MTRIKQAFGILIFLTLVYCIADMVAEHNEDIRYREAIEQALQPE